MQADIQFSDHAPVHSAASTSVLIGDKFGQALSRESFALNAWRDVSSHIDGPLWGTFPFDRAQTGHLYRLSPGVVPSTILSAASSCKSLTRLPASEVYGQAVASAAAQISDQAGRSLRKVVLARALEYETTEAIDPIQVALKLSRDPNVLSYCIPIPDETEQPRWLVGATPELLLKKRGAQISSHPLAGSAKRHVGALEDQAAAQALLQSRKDLIEHRVVVEYIHDVLAPYCRQLDVPSEPALEQTSSLWHLGTQISGELHDAATPCLELLYALHPTPAVAGAPLNDALDFIARSEPFDRDFYAGTLGWVNEKNDGDWYVTLRCAILEQNRARLFAGAGIVADSTPEKEISETRAKFLAMRDALGISAVL